MAAGGRRRDRGGLDAWPGYVDALSTLLMVIIFVLLVFVLAQGFLSVALSSRDRALDRLNRQVAELSELLALERGQAEELRGALGRTGTEMRAAAAARDALAAQLGALRDERDRAGTERDAIRGERDRLQARLADLELAGRGGAERLEGLQAQLAEALQRAEAAGGDTARTLRDLAEARRQLAAEQAALEALRRQSAELDRTVRADRETIEARLADLARLSEQVRSLTALREQLERQAQEALRRAGEEEAGRRAAEARAAEAGGRADSEARRRAELEATAAEQTRLSESARAQVALLTRQLEELRGQMARVAAALDASETATRDRDAQIVNLGQRLNAALAARVEELQRYRSDFFGRLRQVLGDRPEVRIVGDRFVFQSEVLFPAASAELSERGQQQLRELGTVLKDIAARIPTDVPWVLRVDGHADRAPIRSPRFASNWELSAARAIAVAQLLIQEGLPPNRVAAVAFGDNQPLDPGDTPEAYARNRRIELRLTDR
ncbi:peptidoglycan -binding protein [Roseomonas sp. NAR14]|uniref:Peptidoglycan -binding protein n=1 Tax=Roseomonas acroporae TaxID=2937791 RepID=A0A9X1YFW6_9PROT|nr:peptidoglycan -binding protein [Roseomonas acroporae]MCK8785476.1 peptidoglycan -binding protein [Roseomonas acroporae]